MSQEHADLVHRLLEAWNRHDVDALVALLSPDVVWEENPEFPGLRKVYRGPAEVREWAEELLEVIESPQVTLEQITEISEDRLLTEAVIAGRGKGGGVPVELRFWLILWFAAGKVARRQVFWAKEEAFRSAGLSQ